MSERCFRDRWVSAILIDTRLDFDVRGLLASIAEVIMNPSGMNMWASQSDIAMRCSGDRKARKSVNRMLGEAAKAGVIRWEEREDGRRFMIPVMPEAVPESGQGSIPESGHEEVPESGHEPTGLNTQKSNPVGREDDAEFIRDLLVAVWSGKSGQIKQSDIAAALALVTGAGWKRSEVETLVSANAEGAHSVNALRARLARVAHHPTYRKATSDGELRTMLGMNRKRGHHGTSIAGRDGEFGAPPGWSGRLDSDWNVPDDAWASNDEAVG